MPVIDVDRDGPSSDRSTSLNAIPPFATQLRGFMVDFTQEVFPSIEHVSVRTYFVMTGLNGIDIYEHRRATA